MSVLVDTLRTDPFIVSGADPHDKFTSTPRFIGTRAGSLEMGSNVKSGVLPAPTRAKAKGRHEENPAAFSSANDFPLVAVQDIKRPSMRGRRSVEYASR